jgi:hypothetical protein
VQTVHNLFTTQTFNVRLSDTFQVETGFSIPVEDMINSMPDKRFSCWGKNVVITKLSHHQFRVEVKDYTISYFELVLREEDKTTPVGGSRKNKVLETTPNSGTISDFETTLFEPLKPQVKEVTIQDQLVIHRNFIIPVKELFETLKSDKDTWKKGSWEVWVVKNNGKKLDIIIYVDRVSVLGLDLILVEDKTASDNNEECKYLESLKGYWSKQPEHMAKKQSETILNWDKAEQDIKIDKLEQEVKDLKQLVNNLVNTQHTHTNKIHNLEIWDFNLKTQLKDRFDKISEALKVTL